MPIHAPIFSSADCDVDDSISGDNNGVLDDSENADIVINTPNFGSASASNAIATLATSCAYVTINNPSINIGSIPALDDVDIIFNVTVDPSVPIGTIATFDYEITAGSYSLSQSYDLEINLMLEDFESNNFNLYAWQLLGDENWFTQIFFLLRDYCSQSGDIANNQNSVLEVEVDVFIQRFYFIFKKVSSEAWYDYLRFILKSVGTMEWC